MHIETLRAELRGTLTLRDDATYETLRDGLIFNGRKPDRRPWMIVRAANAGDAQAVVHFAAATGRTVSVRGSGHNWSGIAMQDGIVLDLSGLDDVVVDAEARIAEVGPGARNRAVARALAEHGLAFPLGHCGTVAMSGYLLGGGFGWNSGAWGLAAFNVDSVDVVMADGRMLRASETENTDVFWAVRGGGPAFFAAVVRYRLRLRALPRAIMTALWTYPIERVDEVERWMTEAMRRGPNTVEFTALMSSAPPPLAGKVGKVVSGIATTFSDDAEDARRVLAAIAAAAPPGALSVQLNMPTPFDVLYDIMAQFFPEGGRYAVDSFWSERSGPLFRGMAEGIAKSTEPASFAIGVVLPPGAFAPSMVADAALSMYAEAFGAAYAIWTDPAEDEAQKRWLRDMADGLRPEALGYYVGEADLDRPERLAACYSPAAWQRLARLRSTYDPVGVFASAALSASGGDARASAA